MKIKITAFSYSYTSVFGLMILAFMLSACMEDTGNGSKTKHHSNDLKTKLNEWVDSELGVETSEFLYQEMEEKYQAFDSLWLNNNQWRPEIDNESELLTYYKWLQACKDSILIKRSPCIKSTLELSQDNIKILLENHKIDYLEITDQKMKEIGNVMHQLQTRDLKLLVNDPLTDKLKEILDRIMEHTSKREFGYQLHLIDAPIINAYSAIGGHLYFTTRFVDDFVSNEDELAFVIAHEVAHQEQGHNRQKAQLMYLASQCFNKEHGQEIGLSILGFMEPFGRVDEYEADQIGICLMFKAGYNPVRGQKIFDRLQNSKGVNFFKDVMRTHPYAKERNSCIHTFMKDEQFRERC